MYLQFFIFIFFQLLKFSRFPVFPEFLGPFSFLLLVYTTILEQKRIAGQVQNLIICILFKKYQILQHYNT